MEIRTQNVQFKKEKQKHWKNKGAEKGNKFGQKLRYISSNQMYDSSKFLKSHYHYFSELGSLGVPKLMNPKLGEQPLYWPV